MAQTERIVGSGDENGATNISNVGWTR